MTIRSEIIGRAPLNVVDFGVIPDRLVMTDFVDKVKQKT